MRLSFIPLLLLALAAILPAQDTKIYVVTHIDLMGNHVVDATKLLQQYAADSRRDKGSVRFELLVEPSRKNHLTIVSVWDNQAAFETHLEAEHTRKFREMLQPMLGSPFDERLHIAVQ